MCKNKILYFNAHTFEQGSTFWAQSTPNAHLKTHAVMASTL